MRSTIRRLTPLWKTARTSVLTLGGFGSLTAAAWTGLGLWAGLAATGLSCFAVEYLAEDEKGTSR